MGKPIDYKKIERRAAARSAVKNGVTYTLLSLWALLVLFPFYWMLLTSVKSYSSYNGEYIPVCHCEKGAGVTWSNLDNRIPM